MQDELVDLLSQTYLDFDRYTVRRLGAELLKAYQAFAEQIPAPAGGGRLSYIEYGLFIPPEHKKYHRIYGAKIKGKRIPVDYVVWGTEGLTLEQVRDFSIDLSEQEWKALMRAATLTMTAFSRLRHTAAFWRSLPHPIPEERFIASQKNLVATLVTVYRTSQVSNLEALNQKLGRAYLQYGSETPCNITCFEAVEYGMMRIDQSKVRFGLRLKNKAVFVTGVLRHLIELSMPHEMPNYLTDLTEEEWKAALELTLLTLLAFEKETGAAT